jgi:hypothetical protein
MVLSARPEVVDKNTFKIVRDFSPIVILPIKVLARRRNTGRDEFRERFSESGPGRFGKSFANSEEDINAERAHASMGADSPGLLDDRIALTMPSTGRQTVRVVMVQLRDFVAIGPAFPANKDVRLVAVDDLTTRFVGP